MVLATSMSPRTIQRGGQHLTLGRQLVTWFPHSKLLCYWETSLRLSIWTCVLWHPLLCSHSHKLHGKITSTSRTWLPTCVGCMSLPTPCWISVAKEYLPPLKHMDFNEKWHLCYSFGRLSLGFSRPGDSICVSVCNWKRDRRPLWVRGSALVSDIAPVDQRYWAAQSRPPTFNLMHTYTLVVEQTKEWDCTTVCINSICLLLWNTAYHHWHYAAKKVKLITPVLHQNFLNSHIALNFSSACMSRKWIPLHLQENWHY